MYICVRVFNFCSQICQSFSLSFSLWFCVRCQDYKNYSPKLFLRQYIFWFRILFYLKNLFWIVAKGIFFFFPNGYNKIVSSSLLIWNAMILGWRFAFLYTGYTKFVSLFCSIGLFIFSSTDTVWVLISWGYYSIFLSTRKIFNHSWQITPSKFSSRDELSQVEPKPGKC